MDSHPKNHPSTATALIDRLYDDAVEETLYEDGPIDERAVRLSLFARSLGGLVREGMTETELQEAAGVLSRRERLARTLAAASDAVTALTGRPRSKPSA